MRGTDHSPPRCAALTGKVGSQAACGIYEWRPSLLPRIAAGSEASRTGPVAARPAALSCGCFLYKTGPLQRLMASTSSYKIYSTFTQPAVGPRSSTPGRHHAVLPLLRPEAPGDTGVAHPPQSLHAPHEGALPSAGRRAPRRCAAPQASSTTGHTAPPGSMVPTARFCHAQPPPIETANR